ncbi:MAG: methylated-DNA--[protein]-cysteine S-methyltransferase [Tetrasphaera sp.]|nr:methylated-DNA--[protein]-cysteine S-methyltransferase [Tetrasphaera sp.]
METDLPRERKQVRTTGDDDLTRLRARLAAAAHGAEILDIAYRIIDSPIGSLLLARTPRGLVRVAFEPDHEAALVTLATVVSPRILLSPKDLDDAARQIEGYFGGRRRTFTLDLDRALSHGFRGAVQALLPTIPYGLTTSYGALAARAGNPRAVRAVGSACATNPLPIVVPCHRVLRADGSLGGYAGGSPAKAALLTLEATHVPPGSCPSSE